MIEFVMLAAAGAGMLASYVKVRNFVRVRLRFVDAARKPAMPVVAGAAAALVAAPVVALLPVLGAGTAVLFGISVGAGFRSGVREVKRLTGS
ncbi:MAG: hypothetical protein ACE5HF_02105 [Gemmatimonadota bacterium]